MHEHLAINCLTLTDNVALLLDSFNGLRTGHVIKQFAMKYGFEKLFMKLSALSLLRIMYQSLRK